MAYTPFTQGATTASEVITVSVRFDREDYDLLVASAKIRNQKPAALARDLTNQGVRDSLDPDAIIKWIDEQKELLLKASAKFKKKKE